MTLRKALIVGATGLIGSSTIKYLFNDPAYSEVTALVRRTPLLKNHRKLKEVITDFSNLDKTLSTITANDVFCCLGTTIKKAGSQDAFRKVDFSLVVDVARVMRKQGAEQFIVISAMGASSSSKVFYNRIKGEMEEALKNLGYPYLRIIRPSLLLGKREEFRLGERIGIIMSPFWKLFLVGSLKKYCPVKADAVARFMVKVAHEEPIDGVYVYESNQIT
ncbi:MAG: oxidoreductase [Proteobacteria bacterium]|nr:oxidoreductase [Pseudomonadota bacterium]